MIVLRFFSFLFDAESAALDDDDVEERLLPVEFEAAELFAFGLFMLVSEDDENGNDEFIAVCWLAEDVLLAFKFRFCKSGEEICSCWFRLDEVDAAWLAELDGSEFRFRLDLVDDGELDKILLDDVSWLLLFIGLGDVVFIFIFLEFESVEVNLLFWFSVVVVVDDEDVVVVLKSGLPAISLHIQSLYNWDFKNRE